MFIHSLEVRLENTFFGFERNFARKFQVSKSSCPRRWTSRMQPQESSWRVRSDWWTLRSPAGAAERRPPPLRSPPPASSVSALAQVTSNSKSFSSREVYIYEARETGLLWSYAVILLRAASTSRPAQGCSSGRSHWYHAHHEGGCIATHSLALY